MHIKVFVCNPFQENTYLVWDDEKNAQLIDPGFYDALEFSRAEKWIRENGLIVRRALNTHLHLDHCIGNGFVKETFGVDVEAGTADLFLVQNAERQAQMFGLEIPMRIPSTERFLKDGDIVACGEIRLNVLEVPGHSPGGLAFYDAENALLFAGDTLFRNSYGRTDLPGGDEESLFRSVREKLFRLPENTRVFPGHGPTTTIADEIAFWKSQGLFSD